MAVAMRPWHRMFSVRFSTVARLRQPMRQVWRVITRSDPGDLADIVQATVANAEQKQATRQEIARAEVGDVPSHLMPAIPAGEFGIPLPLIMRPVSPWRQKKLVRGKERPCR